MPFGMRSILKRMHFPHTHTMNLAWPLCKGQCKRTITSARRRAFDFDSTRAQHSARSGAGKRCASAPRLHSRLPRHAAVSCRKEGGEMNNLRQVWQFGFHSKERFWKI